MSSLGTSQKLTLFVVGVIVVFLLAPYVGCRIGSVDQATSLRELPTNARESIDNERDEGLDTSTQGSKEPLGQIEDLLSQ